MNDTTATPEVTEKPAKASKPKHTMYKLTIHSGSDKGDQGDVFLGHNGVSFLIQRDKEVTVDERVIDCLTDAVIHTTKKGDDGIERVVKIPRFSYNVMPA